MILPSTVRVLSLLAFAAGADLSARESNLWPLSVSRAPEAGQAAYWSGFGPLAFYRPIGDGRTAGGFRPFYVQREHSDGTPEGGTALYPLLRWENRADGYSWTIFNLANRTVIETPTGTADFSAFDLWPVYFSRDTGSPQTSYRAVFPLYGDVRNRFGQDRWQWFLFPIWGRFEKKGVTTTTAPWPFIKVVDGAGHRGLEVWPIAGRREKPGVTRTEFALWPLLYRHQEGLDEPEPTIQAGFLPFYALDRRPGYLSETFGWPFWGYVDRTEPYRYHATHYLWPLWVQGHGDDRRVNRWAPFYTHSVIKDSDKTWIMWPLWRHQTWADSGLSHERRQLLYFVYHSTEQRSRLRANAAPASKTHVWPLVSWWDNGAGRKQLQALSPLEVFFPHNEHVRLAWSPLFAIYRFDQPAPGDVRHSVLWDGVTYERSAADGSREFHLGPLFSLESRPDLQRIALLGGLCGLRRVPGRTGWRVFFGEAPSPSPHAGAASVP